MNLTKQNNFMISNLKLSTKQTEALKNARTLEGIYVKPTSKFQIIHASEICQRWLPSF